MDIGRAPQLCEYREQPVLIHAAMEQSHQVDKFSAARCVLVGSLSFFPVGGTSNVKGQPQVPQNYSTRTFSIIIIYAVRCVENY
jgi:hypothetical protein